MHRRLFLTGSMAVLFAGCARAQERAWPGLIGEVLAGTPVPALGYAVVTPDGLAALEVAGLRVRGGEAVVSPADKWHLGSNTKAMTAALYARLVEAGRARWGATLTELFPDLTLDAGWTGVTVEDLMRHRAGLTDAGLIDGAWLNGSRADPRPLPEQRTDFAAKALGAPPKGARGAFAYANANYIVAGAAIERLVGGAWEDAMQAEVFGPLGMASAGFGAPRGEQPWGHTPGLVGGVASMARDPDGVADNPAALGPAGTVHASLEDYARFIRLFLTDGGGFLTPDSVARLTSPGGTTAPAYALGWGVNAGAEWARGPMLGHEGSNTMWHAVAMVAPGRGLGIVTVANMGGPGGAAAQALARRLVERHAA